MATVFVFHHALGSTLGIEALADRFRAHGHDVVVPDLFDGRRFDTLDAGVAHAQAIGFGEVIERGARTAAEHDAPAVYFGYSLGVLPAQMLAQTRPDALGAVLCASCVPLSEFGESWPAGVPVQIHAMERDPFFVDEGDLDAALEIVDASPDAALFLYPGDQHTFADSSTPGYDDAATAQMVSRVLDMLGSIDASVDSSPNRDASSPEALRERWADLEARWASTVARAERLPTGDVAAQVDGEWSFSQTLRHLVFATDAWLQRPVLGRPSPFWSAALPHSDCPDSEIAPFGIDRDARPSWHDLLGARAERQAMVRTFLADVTTEQLDSLVVPGLPPPHVGADGDSFTVRQCLGVVLDEETEHLRYATRDLDVLERRARA